jgi:hypothetical protein
VPPGSAAGQPGARPDPHRQRHQSDRGRPQGRAELCSPPHQHVCQQAGDEERAPGTDDDLAAHRRDALGGLNGAGIIRRDGKVHGDQPSRSGIKRRGERRRRCSQRSDATPIHVGTSDDRVRSPLARSPTVPSPLGSAHTPQPSEHAQVEDTLAGTGCGRVATIDRVTGHSDCLPCLAKLPSTVCHWSGGHP